MTERMLITLMVAGGIALLWLGWQWLKPRLVRAIDSAEEATGKPTLLVFTGEYCAVCKFQQAPVIERLMTGLGNAVAVNQVDVSDRPDLAGKYKVLTLPTTVVLNPAGQVAHINYGLADQSQLESQLLGA
jgi:thioredoxin 1